MKNWKMKLTVRGQTLLVVKIQRAIIQGGALSSLLLVIGMTPLICIYSGNALVVPNLQNCKKKNQFLMYMNDIKLFAKDEKELEILIQTIRIYRRNIQMKFGWEKCAMLTIKNGKRQMTEGTEQLNQEKYECLQKKKITSVWEYWMWTLSNNQSLKENKRNLLQMNEKTAQN